MIPVGPNADYLPDPWHQAITFGKVVFDIRCTKPRPVGSRGYSPHMTQPDLGVRLHEVWKLRTGEHRSFDAAWIRKLERGEIRVESRLALCVAEALSADADEKAALLQAAGFNGIAIVLLEEMGIDFESIQAMVNACLGGRDSSPISLNEVLGVIRRQRRVVRTELQRRIQALS